MNERERADSLARAIDELIQGPATPEPHFDDEELRSLLRVARARLKSGTVSGRNAANHEATVWERVVMRLERQEDGADTNDDLLPPEDEMRGVIAARRRMTEEVLELAERHRDDVWKRVQDRIGQQPKPERRSGIFGWLRTRTDGDEPTTPPPSRTRLIPTGDSDLDSLLRVALSHTSLRKAGEQAMSRPQAEIQRRARSDPGRFRRVTVEPERPGMAFWLKVGAAGAFVALLALALGPIPATGFADSPAGQAVRYVGEHIGVMETGGTPPAPGAQTDVTGQDMTVADASAQMGLPLTEPAAVLGLSLASGRYFTTGVTSASGGTFVATYKSDDGVSAVAAYEEAAGGTDFAAPAGTTSDVLVAGGPATYFEGQWTSSNGALAWQPTGTQTLIFERGGVRFVLQYRGPRVDPSDFAAAAAVFS